MSKAAEDRCETAISAAVRSVQQTTLSVALLDGATADDIGFLALQEVANRLGGPLLVDGMSKHHRHRFINPNT